MVSRNMIRILVMCIITSLVLMFVVPSYGNTLKPKSNFSITHFINDFKPSNKPFFQISEWGGGRSFEQDEFVNTIKVVMARMIIYPSNKDDIIKLLLETAAIESDYGRLTKQVKGPAQGVFQFIPSTHKYMRDVEFKKPQHKHLAISVNQFYDRTKNRAWNIRYNLPYQISMILSYYQIYTGKSFAEMDLSTRQKRAVIYKKYFNTPLGVSTVDKYKKKADRHISYSSL